MKTLLNNKDMGSENLLIFELANLELSLGAYWVNDFGGYGISTWNS